MASLIKSLARRFRADDSGVAAVEFALLLPFIVVLLCYGCHSLLLLPLSLPLSYKHHRHCATHCHCAIHPFFSTLRRMALLRVKQSALNHVAVGSSTAKNTRLCHRTLPTPTRDLQ